MSRPRALVLLLAIVATQGAAATERRLTEGLVIRLEPGYFAWNLDQSRIEGQVGSEAGEVGPRLIDQAQNGPGLTLSFGYNIRGHATLAATITGNAWDIGNTQRGGGGLASFDVSWHPLLLLEVLEVIPVDPGRRYDASLFFGAGWGVIGEDRAMRGLHLSLGGRAEYLLTRWFSAGAVLALHPLKFSEYVVDWGDGVIVDLPERSGGSALFVGLTLAIHAPIGVDD